MVFRSHRVRIIIRILLIGIFIALSILAMNQEKWFVATGVSVGIVILLATELFTFIDRSNRDFINLLESMKYEDFTKSYSTRFTEKSFRELESSFNEIRDQFRKTRMEKEMQFQYLQMVINHIQLALICFRQDGGIILYNTSAAKLFRKDKPDQIKKLADIYPDLYRLIQKLEAGQKEVVKVNREGELMRLAVMVTEFRLDEIRNTRIFPEQCSK